MCIFVILFMGLGTPPIYGEKSHSVPVFEVEVIDEYNHDNESWTQGLLMYNDSLYESKGQYGNSSLRKLDLESGNVLNELKFNDTYFAEGIALVDDRIILLTWREGTAFVINIDTFEVISNFSYQGEGWGLCYDGVKLVMSDGSNKLYFREPNTFELIGTINITLEGVSYSGMLNELECVNGNIYANVWYENEIVVIDSMNGDIKSIINVGGLSYQENSTFHEILNGIAFDENNSNFIITGKNWPVAYRVNFVETELTETIDPIIENFDEPSIIIPLLVTLFILIVWAFDLRIRHKVKDDAVKPSVAGEII